MLDHGQQFTDRRLDLWLLGRIKLPLGLQYFKVTGLAIELTLCGQLDRFGQCHDCRPVANILLGQFLARDERMGCYLKRRQHALLASGFLSASFASLFERLVAVGPLGASFPSVGKSHFSPRKRRPRSGALPLLFVEIAKPQFGCADSAGFERFPNQLAAHTNSRIIVSWLNVSNEIRFT